MIRFPELFAALAAPIPPGQVRTRSGGKGGDQAYVKVQTVFNRLDDAVGPADWWDSYQVLDELTVECSLSIRLPDGSVLTKRDVGIRKPIEAGRVDPGCSWKAAYSDALKRAASKLGVARELCKCGMPGYVPDREQAEVIGNPRRVAPASDNLPSQGLPVNASTNEGRAARPAPRTGRALFAWCKDHEERDGVGLLNYLSNWGRLQDYPPRIVDWDPEQARLGHAEACRKLGSIEYRGAVAS